MLTKKAVTKVCQICHGAVGNDPDVARPGASAGVDIEIMMASEISRHVTIPALAETICRAPRESVWSFFQLVRSDLYRRDLVNMTHTTVITSDHLAFVGEHNDAPLRAVPPTPPAGGRSRRFHVT